MTAVEKAAGLSDKNKTIKMQIFNVRSKNGSFSLQRIPNKKG